MGAEAVTPDSANWRTPAETPHNAWARKDTQPQEEEAVSDDDTTKDANFTSEYPIIPVTKVEKERLRRPWRRSLIIRVLGRTVSYTYLLQRLQRMWKPEGVFDLIIISHDYYIAKFEALKDYEFAKFEGPWMVLDHYLVVQEWEPNFCPWKNKTEKLLVWVRFPKLPIEYFEEDFLMKIGLSVGRHVKIDTTTSLTTKGNFARICVEVDMSKPLLSRFVLNQEEWPIEYEGIHLVCFKCGRYGHRQEQCGKEEVNNGDSDQQRPDGNTSRAHSNVFVQGQPEKYGAWMLVSRKDRRNRPKDYYPKEGPSVGRNQVQRANISGEGWGSQSRFTTLDNCDENGMAVAQEDTKEVWVQQQPENALPRIRTNQQNTQRSPQQRDAGPRGGHQNAYRGGYNPANRGGGASE
nr:uncharacterized protein LOC109175269 [Ipomoea batatas]